MDSSKIKNFIILLLVIVNVFFLAIVLSDGAGKRAARREALSEAAEILAANGIAISEDADLRARSLPVCTVSRDTAREREIITGLCGEMTELDQGGGIIFFSGAGAQAEFRGTGDFDVLPTGGEFAEGRDPWSIAEEISGKLGLETAEKSSTLDKDGSGILTLVCQAAGAEALNCRVVFTFSNGELVYLSGVRPLDDITASETPAEVLDLPTVLLLFLDAVNKGGYVCSELKSAELCYLQSASASGTGTLTPVWRLTTDSGAFFFNGVTGKQESVT